MEQCFTYFCIAVTELFMNNDAIGVFDSGVGGLTAVNELNKLMPNENIIYFGDTA